MLACSSAQTYQEDAMKRNIARTILIVFFATLFTSMVPAAWADDSCSTAKAAGNWGATLSGTLLLPTGPVLAAAVIRATIDAQGNIVSATEARNVGGGFANETLTGSWTVNSDCTGTITAHIYENGQLLRTSVLAIVFDDNLREFRMVQESLTLPDGTTIPVVITAQGRKITPGSSD
jgi:hypothetical protein